MTQILSFLCNRFVAQVSDRRLTSSADGSLYDDHTNKCVFYDWRASISFTGLAEIEGEPMHLWLARVLSEHSTSELRGVVEHLARRATETFRGLTIPHHARRTSISGVAWVFPRDQSLHQPTAIGFRVSNFPEGALRDEFQVDYVGIGPRGPARILLEGGVPLSRAVRDHVESAIRHLMRRRADPQAVVESLVRAVRRSADENDTIGRRLLSAVIPRQAVQRSRQLGEGLILAGPPLPTTATFEFWEDGTWNGITYGPTVAAPGSVVSNFESGPLMPSLGGSSSTPGKFQIHYPMAILIGPSGGIVAATREGQTYIAAFTNPKVMEDFVRNESRGARPRIIASPTELREILSALGERFDFVFFNPTGDANEGAQVPIDEILRTPFPKDDGT